MMHTQACLKADFHLEGPSICQGTNPCLVYAHQPLHGARHSRANGTQNAYPTSPNSYHACNIESELRQDAFLIKTFGSHNVETPLPLATSPVSARGFHDSWRERPYSINTTLQVVAVVTIHALIEICQTQTIAMRPLPRSPNGTRNPVRPRQSCKVVTKP